MLSQHCYISPSDYTIWTVSMCQHWANDSFNTDFQIFRSCMYKMWKLKVEIESMLEFDVIKSL